jgi:hypothetical protein
LFENWLWFANTVLGNHDSNIFGNSGPLSPLTVRNTIVAGGMSIVAPDVFAFIESRGHNLIGDSDELAAQPRKTAARLRFSDLYCTHAPLLWNRLMRLDEKRRCQTISLKVVSEG